MLIIAIAHGYDTDPFTTSTSANTGVVDPTDADACLSFICKDKELRPEWIDELLVVETDCQGTSEPEVTHHYTEFD